MRTALLFGLIGVFVVGAAGQGLPDNLTVTSATAPPYQANLTVQTSGAVTVNSAGTTIYTGGQQVILTPGFTAVAVSGAAPTFIAQIAPPPFYPDSGTGGSHNFTVTATDASGAANITNIQVIYNWQPSGVDGCLLNYDVVNDALSMGDLTGSMSTFGSISLLHPAGSLGDLVNSNCQVVGAGSSVTKSGNNVSLALNVFFRAPQGTGDPATGGVPGFIGPQNVYMLTTTADQQQAGSFQLVGSWTPFPVPEPNTFSTPVVINSMNTDGTVTLQFYDPNGFNYEPYTEAVFGASLTDPNACRIRYDRGSGAVNHVLSLYAGSFASVAMIGMAPVGSPGAVVQDTATCIVDIAHSSVVQDAGTGAIVKVALSFKTTGTINTYVQGFDRQGLAGALQTGSIYIAPNSFSLSPVNAVGVVQGAAPAAFTLNVPVTGTFSGAVSLSATGVPAGVSVQFQQNPLSVPSPGNTAVTVTASSAAALGSFVMTITGTGGGLTSVTNVTVNVLPATAPPVTFTLSGNQTVTDHNRVFVVAVTSFTGLNHPETIQLSVDPLATSSSVSAGLNVISVVPPASFQVNVDALYDVPGPGPQCAVIDANSGTGEPVQQISLCVGGYSTNIFTVPLTPPAIMVPSGGSTTVYGVVNTFSPNFTQVAVCGVSPCDASATFGAVSNSVVPITFSSGSLPVGTTYTQNMSANGVSQNAAITVRAPRVGDYLTFNGQVSFQGTPLPGVTVSVSGTTSNSVLTDGNGRYTFSSVPFGGSYTLIPSAAEFQFVPPSVAINHLTGTMTNNFSGVPIDYNAGTGTVSSPNSFTAPDPVPSCSDISGLWYDQVDPVNYLDWNINQTGNSVTGQMGYVVSYAQATCLTANYDVTGTQNNNTFALSANLSSITFPNVSCNAPTFPPVYSTISETVTLSGRTCSLGTAQVNVGPPVGPDEVTKLPKKVSPQVTRPRLARSSQVPTSGEPKRDFDQSTKASNWQTAVPRFSIQYSSFIPVDHITGPSPCLLPTFLPYGLKLYKGDKNRNTYRTTESVLLSVYPQTYTNLFSRAGPTRNYQRPSSPANATFFNPADLSSSALGDYWNGAYSGADEDNMQNDCHLWNNKGEYTGATMMGITTDFSHNLAPTVELSGYGYDPLEPPLAPIRWDFVIKLDLTNPSAPVASVVGGTQTCYPEHIVKVNGVTIYDTPPALNSTAILTSCLTGSLVFPFVPQIPKLVPPY